MPIPAKNRQLTKIQDGDMGHRTAIGRQVPRRRDRQRSYDRMRRNRLRATCIVCASYGRCKGNNNIMISLLETLFISPVPEPATSCQPAYLLDTEMNTTLPRTTLHRRMFANCQCYRHPRCTTHRMRSRLRALTDSAISRVSNGQLPRANFSSGTGSSPSP